MSTMCSAHADHLGLYLDCYGISLWFDGSWAITYFFFFYLLLVYVFHPRFSRRYYCYLLFLEGTEQKWSIIDIISPCRMKLYEINSVKGRKLQSVNRDAIIVICTHVVVRMHVCLGVSLFFVRREFNIPHISSLV